MCLFQDNSLLVRNGVSLRAIEFLDSETRSASVVGMFQNPRSGLITQVLLTFNLRGLAASTSAKFRHLGFVRTEEKDYLLGIYSALFGAILISLAVNFRIVLSIRRQSRARDTPITHQDVGSVCFGVLPALIILAFSIASLIYNLGTEDRAVTFVDTVGAIPIAAPDVSFSDKVRRIDCWFRIAVVW